MDFEETPPQRTPNIIHEIVELRKTVRRIMDCKIDTISKKAASDVQLTILNYHDVREFLDSSIGYAQELYSAKHNNAAPENAEDSEPLFTQESNKNGIMILKASEQLAARAVENLVPQHMKLLQAVKQNLPQIDPDTKKLIDRVFTILKVLYYPTKKENRAANALTGFINKLKQDFILFSNLEEKEYLAHSKTPKVTLKELTKLSIAASNKINPELN